MTLPSEMFAPLYGLELALEIQGGLHGLEQVRTDAGLYLYHDVGDYISRRQTYTVDASLVVDASAGAGFYTGVLPSTGGLRFGRYLSAFSVITNSLANLSSVVVKFASSSQQPDFPASLAGVELASFSPTTSRPLNTNFFLVRESLNCNLPLWMPPGSLLNLLVTTSGIGGSAFTLKPLWHTTEQLSQASPRAPIGQLQGPIKI